MWDCGFQVCVNGALFHFISSQNRSVLVKWNRTGDLVCVILLNGHIREAILCDNHRKSKTPNQKMLAAAVFHWAPPFILIDNQWCWPSELPLRDPPTLSTCSLESNAYTIKVRLTGETFLTLLWLFHVIPTCIYQWLVFTSTSGYPGSLSFCHVKLICVFIFLPQPHKQEHVFTS